MLQIVTYNATVASRAADSGECETLHESEIVGSPVEVVGHQRNLCFSATARTHFGGARSMECPGVGSIRALEQHHQAMQPRIRATSPGHAAIVANVPFPGHERRRLRRTAWPSQLHNILRCRTWISPRRSATPRTQYQCYCYRYKHYCIR